MSIKKNYKKMLAEWTESLVITVLFILVSEYFQNPLSLKSVFPWICFAPVLVALRYGLWPSLFSFGLILSSYFYRVPKQIYNPSLQLFVLGGFLLILVCIIFHNSWKRKITFSDNIATYLKKRMQSIADTYEIVQFAFQQLEHSYVSRPVTVRSSLGEIRQAMAISQDNIQENILSRFLNIVAFHCSLEVVAIYPVQQNELQLRPITSIGKITIPTENNYLIKNCIKYGVMTYISEKEILNKNISNYLVAAPFLDQKNNVYALLLIEEMPFLKLNEDNLNTINIFLRYFAEGNCVGNADLILKKFPDCNIEFANELQRLTVVQKKTKQDSALVVYSFLDTAHEPEYLFKLRQAKRGLDCIWETRVNNQKKLLILMPLTSITGVESYRIRINDLLLHEFNIQLNQDAVKFRSGLISSFKNPIDLIEDLLQIK